MKRPSGVSGDDPLWYKDAIIYELHVRAFYDSNGDGIGDFAGLTEKLDYLAGPRRHRALAAAVLSFAAARRRLRHRRLHRRPSRLRHARRTSRVPATRRTRAACASSPSWCSTTPPTSTPGSSARAARRRAAAERDFYVWSDTPEKYRDARIIFQDFEPSNWTWDPVAKAYFWHRFYSHQPDLNFDNPAVQRGAVPRASTSGSSWASTACGSTPCPTSTSARARTARTCPRRTPS